MWLLSHPTEPLLRFYEKLFGDKQNSIKNFLLKMLDVRPGFIIKFLKHSLIVNFI